MSIKKVCDRCNKVKEYEEVFAHVDCIVGSDHKNSEYDLCQECTKLFNIFINGGMPEPEKEEEVEE